MPDSLVMTAQFTLAEFLHRHGIGQSQLSRESGVSFSTISRMCRNATEQVSLKTLDNLASTLSRLTGTKVKPGDLIGTVRGRR